MAVPLFGFACSFFAFSLIGAALLVVIRRPPVSFLTLICFTIVAQVGSIGFLVLYRYAVATPSGELKSGTAISGLYAGSLVAACSAGWVAAWAAERLRR